MSVMSVSTVTAPLASSRTRAADLLTGAPRKAPATPWPTSQRPARAAPGPAAGRPPKAAAHARAAQPAAVARGARPGIALPPAEAICAEAQAFDELALG